MINLFAAPESDREITEILHSENNVRIEKIISNGNTTDWYDQSEAEWVSVLEGEAELTFDDKIIRLKKGDNYYLPPHCRHKITFTANPTICLCVFYLI